ncbi:MAG TPA: hypothetical protein VMG82_18120 [Candidatus Sulfotelmatobacter sp.]|nr:hypothetical protein [Candidatus Sulfotelmatobacter sp.]
MMCFGRRSILNVPSVLIIALVVLSGVSWAQHPVIPVHPVAPVNVSPPPIYRAPVMQTPVVRPPITYAPVHNPPIYTPPRNGIFPTVGGFGTSIVLPPVRPVHPIRPVPPVVFIYSPYFFFGNPFWQFNSCWSAACNWFWPWTYAYATASSPGPINYVAQPTQTPVYVYGGEREDFPQLFLKDGTILNVTDYWLVDDQLHFKIIEAIGQEPVEHSVPFEELDLQKTVDANTARGFRFILRNAPYEQYLGDHPEGPPPALPPSNQ